MAVLIAILAVLLLAGPAGSAAGPADVSQRAVTAAFQATPETAGASDRLDALPPLRHHLIQAAPARHRSGGHPLPAILIGAGMLLPPVGAFILVHRCARATQAPPGRLAMSYPMRT